AQAPNAMWRSYLDIGSKAFGWDKRHGTGDAQSGPIKTGMGCSVHQWGGGGRGSKAHVDIMADGGVVVKCGTQDLGTGTRTIVAIVAAETLGLPVSGVKPEIGDTNYPFSGGAGGSTAAAGGPAGNRVGAGKGLGGLRSQVGPASGLRPGAARPVNGRIQVQ